MCQPWEFPHAPNQPKKGVLTGPPFYRREDRGLESGDLSTVAQYNVLRLEVSRLPEPSDQPMSYTSSLIRPPFSSEPVCLPV